MEPLTCSIVSAADALSVSRVTIYNYLKDGKLEAVKVGGRRLVKIDSIKRLVGA
jgi:excisionase family DNA binding protein